MKTTLLRYLLASIFTLLAISNGGGNTGAKSPTNHLTAGVATKYQQLPLFFEANEGQADARVRFLARSEGYTLYVTATESVLVEGQTGIAGAPSSGKAVADFRSAKPATLRMKLVEANAAPKVT